MLEEKHAFSQVGTALRNAVAIAHATCILIREAVHRIAYNTFSFDDTVYETSLSHPLTFFVLSLSFTLSFSTISPFT